MSVLSSYILNERSNGLKLFLLFNSPFLLHKVYRFLYPQLKPKIATMLSDTDDYIERNTSRFLKIYQTNQDNQLNTNMNQEFYSKETYQSIIKNVDNQL